MDVDINVAATEILQIIIKNESTSIKEQSVKFSQYTELLNRWLYVKNIGGNIEKYFKANNYRRIAIYGMAFLGERFLEEMEKTEVVVAYGIDRAPLSVCARNKIKVIGVHDKWDQEIDAVIVTPVTYYEELQKMIKSKVSCPVISLKDVIWAL